MTDPSLATIREALRDGRAAEVRRLTQALAEQAAGRFQTINAVAAMLAYHDQLALLIEMMRAAWPRVKAAQGIHPPARNAFAAQATDIIIYHHLEQTGMEEADAANAALIEALNEFFPIDEAGLRRYLAVLAGREQREWENADFDFADPDTASGQHLATLLIAFAGFARREAKIPYGQSALFREQWPDYLTLRRSGQLAPRRPIDDLMRGRRPAFLDAPPEPAHPLCPDPVTLQEYLPRLLHPAKPQPYRAAATVGLIPIWLRFLQRRGVIDTAVSTQVQHELQDVINEWRAWVAEHPDPALKQSLRSWTNAPNAR